MAAKLMSRGRMPMVAMMLRPSASRCSAQQAMALGIPPVPEVILMQQMFLFRGGTSFFPNG